ncbi:DUF4355 domain-containing protein [Halobacillus karajensis]|uniref:DUF4355 domain-containing protein n=1 Tax=Halobacillus karajensis TaxID=195088 RepID=A0A059NW94_9BACI|nr:DUF4355 domain-containing protein [Halobacillus karajensis]CDQ22578.1 hypothetical protein BN983_00791 [Halobacillus karajensis]CDQ26060.1 hypothetical protein BN981_00271 [Halobacillus karajensis]
MDLEQVKQFLNENKEDEQVKAYLNELSAPTREQVEGFLDTEEGKKVLQPRLDQNFTKGLNSWKENNLSKLVDERVKELYPEETEEQRRIKALEQELENQRKESQREKLMNKAVSHASENGLPTEIVSYFLGEDEDSTMKNLETLKETFDTNVQKAVEQKFEKGGREIPQGDDNPKQVTTNLSELAKEASIRK